MGTVFSCPGAIKEPQPQGSDGKHADVQKEPLGFWEYFRGSIEVYKKVAPVGIAFATTYYDLTVYGTLYNEITFNFFQNSSILFWASFTVNFCMRPVGGYFIGLASDWYGRRPAVMGVSYMIAVTSVAPALLPTQYTVLSPTLFILLRMCYGFVGGGISTIITYATESPAPEYLNAGTAFFMYAGILGSVMATTVCAILSTVLSTDQMMAWGWRIPYLLLILPNIYSVHEAHDVEETEDYERVHQAQEALGDSAAQDAARWQTTKAHLPQAALFMGLMSSAVAVNIVGSSFIVPYLTTVAGLSVTTATWMMEISYVPFLLITPVFSWLSDRHGGSVVLLTGCTISAVTIIPLCAAVTYLDSPYPSSIVFCTVFGVMNALITPNSTMTSGFFPTEIRGTVRGVMFNMTYCIFGGFTPLILTWLQQYNLMAMPYFLSALFAMTATSAAVAVHWHRTGTPLSYLREEPF